MNPLDFIILMIAFLFVAIIGVWLAKGTEDFVNYKNEQYRQEQLRKSFERNKKNAHL